MTDNHNENGIILFNLIIIRGSTVHRLLINVSDSPPNFFSIFVNTQVSLFKDQCRNRDGMKKVYACNNGILFVKGTPNIVPTTVK